jgi:hypothetical protein
MQFLLIIAHDKSFAPTPALISGIGAWIGEMQRRGIRLGGNPLRPPRDATTVRVRKGRRQITAGPFSASREQMCAYELIECANLRQAISLAARHPMAKVATIEARPVWAELAGTAKRQPKRSRTKN